MGESLRLVLLVVPARGGRGGRSGGPGWLQHAVLVVVLGGGRRGLQRLGRHVRRRRSLVVAARMVRQRHRRLAIGREEKATISGRRDVHRLASK